MPKIKNSFNNKVAVNEISDTVERRSSQKTKGKLILLCILFSFLHLNFIFFFMHIYSFFVNFI